MAVKGEDERRREGGFGGLARACGGGSGRGAGIWMYTVRVNGRTAVNGGRQSGVGYLGKNLS